MTRMNNSLDLLDSADPSIRPILTHIRLWLNNLKCPVRITMSNQNICVGFSRGDDWAILGFGPGERFACSSAVPLVGDKAEKIAEIRKRFDS